MAQTIFIVQYSKKMAKIVCILYTDLFGVKICLTNMRDFYVYTKKIWSCKKHCCKNSKIFCDLCIRKASIIPLVLVSLHTFSQTANQAVALTWDLNMKYDTINPPVSTCKKITMWASYFSSTFFVTCTTAQVPVYNWYNALNFKLLESY